MKVSRRTTFLAAPVLAGLVGCSKVAEEGSDYPTEDIRLIIQADPGGGSDLSSRALAKEMETELGVSVVPENMPGAAGAIAMEHVGEQSADGYTIGFCPVEIAMLKTTQNANVLPENYTFIGQIMLAPGVISVASDSPYETLEDLIEAATSQALTVGTAGAGSIWEAAALGVNKQAGTQFSPVAYDGGAPAVAAAASGEAAAAVSGAGEAIAQGDSVRILGIMHDEQMPDLPDTPTFQEAIGADIQFGGWGGIYAPADLPDDVLSTLEAAVKTAVESESYKEFQDNAGNLVVYKNAEEFTTFVEEEFSEFQELLG